MSIGAGLHSELCVGLQAGLDADCAGGGPTVSIDATSGKYVPANAGEWAIFLSLIGSTLAAPHHLWLLQEAGGNPADTIGGGLGTRNLTATTLTNAPLYRKPITGWSRGAIGGPGAMVNSNLANTSMVQTASSSYLVFFYARSAAATVLRNICAYGTPLVIQPASAKTRLRLTGSIADTVADHAGATVHPYLFSYNLASSSCKLYSDLEALSVTFGASGGLTLTFQCSSTGDTTAADFLYAAAWDGAAGETSDAEARKLIQGLGYSPPW